MYVIRESVFEITKGLTTSSTNAGVVTTRAMYWIAGRMVECSDWASARKCSGDYRIFP